MASQTKTARAIANTDGAGVAWVFSDQDAAAARDSGYVSASVPLGFDEYTKTVIFTDFRDDDGEPFDLPVGSTDINVVLRLIRAADVASAITDQIFRLVLDGAVAGANRAEPSNAWPITDTWKAYGGDNWGAAPSVDQINASDFGVAIAAVGLGDPATPRIDCVELTVHYDPPEVDIDAYAQPEDVAEYTGLSEGSLPDDIARLLVRASELVDYATRGNIDQGDADHLLAAQNAVCAQIESWIANGEGADVGTGEGIQSYTKGKVSVTYSSGGSGGLGGRLCIRAYRFLMDAGLLYTEVDVV